MLWVLALFIKERTVAVKRYTLGLPDQIYTDLIAISKSEGMTLKAVIIRCLKLSLFVFKLLQGQGGTIEVIVRVDGDEKLVEHKETFRLL